MAGYRRRGDGYQVYWRDPDGKQRSKQVASIAAAREVQRQVQYAQDVGQRWKPRDAVPEPPLRRIAEAWLTDFARVYEASTSVQHAHRLDLWLRWLQSREGRRTKLRAELLTRNMLSEFHAELDGFEGRKRAVSTRNKYVRTVMALWRWAFEDEEIGEWVPRPKTLRLRKPPRRRTRALPWNTIDQVIALAHGRHRQLLVVLRYTGLRVSQAMQLRWDDFDLDNARLWIRPELGKSAEEKTGREIPISRHLVAEISGWGVREGYLLDIGDKQSRVARPRDVHRFWERAKVPEDYWKRRPYHAFRKAFRTNLKAAGADPEALEYYMGHNLEGERSTYTDPWAYPMQDLVKLIPKIGAAEGRVVRIAGGDR